MSQTSHSNKVISADLSKDNTNQTQFVSWQAALKVFLMLRLTLIWSNNSLAQEGMTLLSPAHLPLKEKSEEWPGLKALDCD